MVDHTESKDIKVVLAGLDNAGKSSYLIALRKKYNFWEKVTNLKPTIKIDYSTCNILGKYMLNIWDMGGQEKYRKVYLDHPVYFENTDVILFLIDIQDEIRFENSVNYLHEVLEIYRDLEYKNEINICFHKYDPEIKKLEEYEERKQMLKQLIKKVNPDMTFRFFETSFYNIYSLTKALSSSLNKIIFLEEVNKKIIEFGTKYTCDYIILFTRQGLIIADYYKEIVDPHEYDTKIIPKINEDLEFFQELTDERVKITEKLDFTEEFFTYVTMFQTQPLGVERRPSTIFLSLKAPRMEGSVDLIKSNVLSLLENIKKIIV